MRIRLLGLGAGLIATTFLGACGGGSGGPQVASLGDGVTATTEATGGQSGPDAAQQAEFQDALLEFTECMRDNGIDMPDPQFDGSGGGGIAIAGGPGGEGGIDPESEEFQAAQEECQPILEEVRQGIEIDPEQQAEMQDRMLEFAQCMRDHGIDMPDPQFDDGGGVTISGGPAVEGDDGAGRTGPDPDDPEFQAALEECNADGAGIRFGSGADDEQEGDE